ncbi:MULTISPECIES: MobA/MobL family protein [unclassified Sphingomonas]|uniref:MobA/MobL family protein n=1 Tax=unclassified Sphingomonas TaxID=196159 RepID=UPI000A61E05D|nr:MULTISPECIES: MobA/MobL family protein [unclassified Sphingomonas]
MKVGYAKVKERSDAIQRALADARSARNRITRQRREQDRDAVAAGRRQRARTAKEDRDRERAGKRRIRVQVAEHDRPRRIGTTPRRLFTRQMIFSTGTPRARGQERADGFRSIHFSLVARGFRSTAGRRWRAGEAGRAALYAVREDALEGGEVGWWSNIAADRAELLAFWRTVEAVERHDRANANVYVVEVIALDATLTEADRRAVVTDLCDDLERRGLAFVVGMHKPDSSGDQRNFHCHLMYSLRPAERHAPYDWSFAVSKVGDINTPAGIRARRSLAVDTMNWQLMLAGSDRRYTALSNKARGIVDTPQPKLGKRAVWVGRRLDAERARMNHLDQLGAGLASLNASFSLSDRFVNIRNSLRATLHRASVRVNAPDPTKTVSVDPLELRSDAVRRVIADRLHRLLSFDIGLYDARLSTIERVVQERVAALPTAKSKMVPLKAAGVVGEQSIDAALQPDQLPSAETPVAAPAPIAPMVIANTTNQIDAPERHPGEVQTSGETNTGKHLTNDEHSEEDHGILQLALIARLFHDGQWDQRDWQSGGKKRSVARGSHVDAGENSGPAAAEAEAETETPDWDEVLLAKLRDGGGRGG